ncbi:MAG TPA: GyrI-like domain-containing protein [Candidatus Blautia intestinigallinarum]|nr:GyrI-like domain-containing protein [Candidatus Blautia intestinigallinarum]
MAFDYKKEYKEFYLPKKRPEIIEMPSMNFLAVRGMGDPNEEGGDYKISIGLLYGIAFTIKMSKMGNRKIEGYFDYVMPPLEGFWWQEGMREMDFTRKADFQWISMIRLPDFVKREDFQWAKNEAQRKKNRDFSRVEFMTFQEGLCVQCMHIGSYDEESATMEEMNRYLTREGFVLDFTEERRHHEIYLSDARRIAPQRRRTVIRDPIKKIQE